MSLSSFEIWFIIIALGIGTFLLRFSFLGVIGDRALPPFVLRILRYTAVGVLPAMVGPLVLWPVANGGQPEPSRLIAAGVTLAVAIWTRNAVFGILAGATTLIAATAWFTQV